MISAQRRSPRYPFFASANIVEQRTGVRLTARTSELSRHGCYLDMMNPLPIGSIIKVEIVNHEKALESRGHVIYSQSNVGMAVAFDELSTRDTQILENWLHQLKG
jgi:hypothetical protein